MERERITTCNEGKVPIYLLLESIIYKRRVLGLYRNKYAAAHAALARSERTILAGLRLVESLNRAYLSLSRIAAATAV